MPRIVQYEQRIQPNGGGVTPYAHAPKIEGVGLGGIVDAIDAFMSNYNKRQEEQARAWAADALSQARLDWTAQLVERQANVTPGALDFTADFVRDYDEYANKLFESAPTDTARKYLHERMSELRSQMGEKAITFESQARIDYRNDKFNKAIDNSQKLMNTDDSQYEVVLAERLAEIDASAMPPKQKSEIRERAIEKISEAAVWSQINKSPTSFLNSIGLGTHGVHGVGPTVIDAKTGAIISQGNFGDETNPGGPKGPMGKTGNKPFDMLTFDRRTQFVAQALNLKNSIDNEADRASEKDRKLTADYYMKEAFARANPIKGQKPLDRAFVEEARQWVTSHEYSSLLKLLESPDGDGGSKTNPESWRKLNSMLYTAPNLVYGEALRMHKVGDLSNSDLSSILTKANSLERQGGPKTEYERSRQRIIDNLDPGPLVQDPVGRTRMAEAIYEYDAWVESNRGKKTDKEIADYGAEIIKRYKFIDLSKSSGLMPQPRTGTIDRSATREQKLKQIGDAWNRAKELHKQGKMPKAEFDAEAERLRNWWQAVEKEAAAQQEKK